MRRRSSQHFGGGCEAVSTEFQVSQAHGWAENCQSSEGQRSHVKVRNRFGFGTGQPWMQMGFGHP